MTPSAAAVAIAVPVRNVALGGTVIASLRYRQSMNTPIRFGFEHSYAALPPGFHARVEPTPVKSPALVAWNRELAEELRLDPQLPPEDAAAIFSGNRLPEDALPLSMAYAGHQFGGFVPRLGDGRAILLGEIRDRQGVLRDVQLKGSGLTPFSREADGRAALGPMLREYVISEAMHWLGIPTTRSLAVVTTGEQVYRENVEPGAVLTRVATSHIRVGTFQYFAARGDEEALRTLRDYVIARHYPAARDAAVPALAVLNSVAERQASLIARWMHVGFIHGVMNTDNMAISGETIDYGPCAFMDNYHPGRKFSSIDYNGRYSFANQPIIAQWNLARLAETLIPFIHTDGEKAVEIATEAVRAFMPRFDEVFLGGMRQKLGFASSEEGDVDLIKRLLEAMQEADADFTLTFRRLATAAEGAESETGLRELFANAPVIDDWLGAWRQRLARDPQPVMERVRRMRAVSPAFIPRNHRVEAALKAASRDGDFSLFHRLLEVVKRPYDEQPEAAEYAQPPEPEERVQKTFCGT
jgi:uncharacterized protein YdiU (UPF0061 family)